MGWIIIPLLWKPIGHLHFKADERKKAQGQLKEVRRQVKINELRYRALMVILYDINLDQLKILLMEKETQKYSKTALNVLEETSRTFYIPIVKLPERAQEAVASAYLCLRAIDEVEDHHTLSNEVKAKLLTGISHTITTYLSGYPLKFEWQGLEKELPEVTLRLSEWINYCP